jgi:hypothetical protein
MDAGSVGDRTLSSNAWKETSMEARTLNGHRRPIVAALATVALAAVVGTGVAFATPAGPPGASTATTLADGRFVNTINANTEPTKLRTKDAVEVFQVSNIANAGWTSGWHAHTGPVLVNITSGSLTFYAADCTVTLVSAGHGYFETPGEPILARNEGGADAAWVTTQIIPVGASRRVDVAGRCGVQ